MAQHFPSMITNPLDGCLGFGACLSLLFHKNVDRLDRSLLSDYSCQSIASSRSFDVYSSSVRRVDRIARSNLARLIASIAISVLVDSVASTARSFSNAALQPL